MTGVRGEKGRKEIGLSLEKGQSENENGKVVERMREREMGIEPYPNQVKSENIKLFPIFVKPSSGIKNQTKSNAVKKRTAKSEKKFKEKSANYYTFNSKKAQDNNPEMMGDRSKNVGQFLINKSLKKDPETINKDEVKVCRSVIGGKGHLDSASYKSVDDDKSAYQSEES